LLIFGIKNVMSKYKKIDMKPVILITSHLNSSEKIDTIKKHVNKIKKFTNLPIVHASNYYVNEEIQELFDYTVIKKNEKSNRYSIAWDTVDIDGKTYNLTKTAQDHGFSHIDLMLYGFKVCETLSFDYVYHLNYDVELDKENIDEFINNGLEKTNRFYSYKEINNDIRITNNIFSIEVNEFINAVSSKLEIYRSSLDNNLFGLKSGWLSEEFFEWIFNSYYGYNVNINYINYDDIIKGDWDEHKFNMDDSIFRFYSDYNNNRIIYVNTDKKFTKNSFTLINQKNQELKIKKYSDNFFVSEIIHGMYFRENKFILEINSDKLNRYKCEIIE